MTRVTMFKTLWFGVKRPDMCNIVTILSSTIRRRITTSNAMEKNPHFRDSRYITIPTDVSDNSMGKLIR